MLVGVLAALLVVGIVGAALVGMTISTLSITKRQAESAALERAADGALETVVGRIRADQHPPSDGCAMDAATFHVTLPAPEGSSDGPKDFIVGCTSFPPSSGERNVRLVASLGSEVAGVACVRFGDSPEPGRSVTINRWVLGRNTVVPPTPC